MNYRMHRRGEDLGIFPLEELRRRLDAGELTGGEYVQGEGKTDWQPLNLVLRQGYRASPPPLPTSVPISGPNLTVIWAVVGGGVFLFILVAAIIGLNVIRMEHRISSLVNETRAGSALDQPNPDAVAAASKPIVWTTNTLTAADAQKRAREFRIRQWLDGYEKRGRHNPANDAEISKFLQTWIARTYGGDAATNSMSLPAESDRLAADANCTDPLVLTVAANENRNNAAAISIFERALAAYPGSQHRAYPKFYATVCLAGSFGEQPERLKPLDLSALGLLPNCFGDGSFTPADQQEIAELFVNGRGRNFFQRNAASVCAAVREAGPDYRWLALTLDGEREIAEAWAARGSGYVNSVTEQGWQGFNGHLKQARDSLTQAWNLRPDFPLAPCRMMTVALGDSDITGMRLWFDRTLSAQVDYAGAWSEMRWGLRPRWYGNEEAMLALGKTAINTGRFDTDVPRQFVDSVYDVESELGLQRGQHVFGRSDIWPELQRMYEGYIRQAQPYPGRQGEWRTVYAIIAYHGGKYDVARAQLEALDWKPEQNTLSGWNLDPMLWPLEVAARSGPLGEKISAAELIYQEGDRTAAFKQYLALSSNAAADERTKEFIQSRLASLNPAQYQTIPMPSRN